MGTVIVDVQQLDASPSVVLPQKDCLIVDKLAAMRVNDFPPEMLILQQIQEIQAHRVLEKPRVFWFLPVQQILQVIDERLVFKKASLR